MSMMVASPEMIQSALDAHEEKVFECPYCSVSCQAIKNSGRIIVAHDAPSCEGFGNVGTAEFLKETRRVAIEKAKEKSNAIPL